MLDASSVVLPSGKRLSELTDLKSISLHDAAYVVARHMFASANGSKQYRGSVGRAMRDIWPGQENGSHNKSIPRILRRNGFAPVNNATGFYWVVPDVFPVWNEAGSYAQDDGSQTEAGPVRKLRITKPMRELYVTIAANPGRHPREYAEAMGWSGHNVTQIAATLYKYGFIERKGERRASRYYPTKKVLPIRVPISGPVVASKPVSAPVPKAVPQTNEERELELVGGNLPPAQGDWPSTPTIYKLNGYYQIVNGRPVKIHIQEG